MRGPSTVPWGTVRQKVRVPPVTPFHRLPLVECGMLDMFLAIRVLLLGLHWLQASSGDGGGAPYQMPFGGLVI